MADTETRNRLLDERAAIVREYEKTTQEWIKETTALTSLSSSSDVPGQGQEQEDSKNEGGKQEKRANEGKNTSLQERRTELAERLRSGYWQLDPYLRAKTLYDRLGVIREGGKLQFYDDSTTSTTKASTSAATKSSPNDSTRKAAAATAAAGGGGRRGVNNNNKNNNENSTSTSTSRATATNAEVGHRDHDLD